MKESMEAMFEGMDEVIKKDQAKILDVSMEEMDEINIEAVENYNSGIKVYKAFKDQCIELAEIEDKRYSEMKETLDRIEKMIIRK